MGSDIQLGRLPTDVEWSLPMKIPPTSNTRSYAREDFNGTRVNGGHVDIVS